MRVPVRVVCFHWCVFLYKSACDTRADKSNLLGDGPGGDDDYGGIDGAGDVGDGGCDGGADGNGDDVVVVMVVVMVVMMVIVLLVVLVVMVVVMVMMVLGCWWW